MTEKLQKILSRAGIASRRALEQMIDEGRVYVNGKMANVGDRYDASQITVRIDGKQVFEPSMNETQCRVLMYHKPEGELTTLSDPENRPTVYDHIPNPPSGKWIYIGRLDINTSGLLLFTTDGELANALMHPKYEVERIYAARIYGDVTEEQLEQLTQGVQLEDGKARFNKVEFRGGEGRNAWYHVTLKEGRKREVRRLWEAVGLQVSRLIRIKYAGVELDANLRTGQYRELNLNEINRLRKAVALEPLEQVAAPLNSLETGSTKSKSIVKKDKRTSFNKNSANKPKTDGKKPSFNRNGQKMKNENGRKFGNERFDSKKRNHNDKPYSKKTTRAHGFKVKRVADSRN